MTNACPCRAAGSAGYYPQTIKTPSSACHCRFSCRLFSPVLHFYALANSSGHWNSSAGHRAVNGLSADVSKLAAAGIRIYERARAWQQKTSSVPRAPFPNTPAHCAGKHQKRVSGFPRVRVLTVRPACRFLRINIFPSGSRSELSSPATCCREERPIRALVV